jgi:YHS domain-containing protein
MADLKNKEKCLVCGMSVDTSTGLKTEYKGHSYYFCSEGDKKIFMENPEKYIGKEHATKAA